MTKKAIVIGASGLIGSTLLDLLLTQPEYDEVMIMARKKIAVDNSKLQQLIVDFNRLDSYSNLITGEVIFSCLGSTKRQTPDPAQYRRIDHDYPVKLAEIALKNGIKQFHIVSSVGADATAASSYLKLKGETEDDLKKIGIKSLSIYQPSVLMGDRENGRPMEKFAAFIIKVVSPLLIGGLKKFRGMPAKTLAMAMFKNSLNPQPGIHTYTFNNITELS